MGDLLQFSKHNATDEFINNVFFQGFVPVIAKPTRITPASATLIDHICACNIVGIYRQNYKPSKSSIIITDMADHFGVFQISETPLLQSLPKYVCKRSFIEQNIKKFRELINKSNFSDICSHDNPNEAYNSFLKIVLKSYEQAFPKT